MHPVSIRLKLSKSYPGWSQSHIAKATLNPDPKHSTVLTHPLPHRNLMAWDGGSLEREDITSSLDYLVLVPVESSSLAVTLEIPSLHAKGVMIFENPKFENPKL